MPIQIQHLIHRFRRFTQIFEARRMLVDSSDNLRKSVQSVDKISSEFPAEIHL
jgi:hypothetical protein